MKISIIIPVYNVEAYIEECLQSLMSQTYTGAMECIIVDDCGQDQSIEIAQQLIDRYEGTIDFRIERHEHNRGLSAARNTGMDVASGDYIYFIDSDDSILPETLELFVDMLIKHPDSEMIQAGAISDNHCLDIENKTLPEYSDNHSWIKCTILKRYIIPMTSWNKLFSKDFLIKHNLRFKEGIIHEDELFNFFLSKHLTKVGFVRKNLYKYRTVRPHSIMGSTNTFKEDKAWIEICADCCANLDELCFKEQFNMIYWALYTRYFTVRDKRLRSQISYCFRQLSLHTDSYRRILLRYLASGCNNINVVKVLNKITGCYKNLYYNL